MVNFTLLKLCLLKFTFDRAPRDHDADYTLSGAHQSNKFELWLREDQPFPAAWTERKDFEERKIYLHAMPQSVTCDLVALPASTVTPSSLPEDAKERMDMAQPTPWKTTFVVLMPEGVIPNFHSFAITRAHKVRVRLGVDIDGKKLEMDTECGVVSVLEEAVS